jgi:hypothetical protein
MILSAPAARRVWLRLAHWTCIPVACLAGSALASTPQAWSAYDAEVLKACIAASSLKGTHAAGRRVDFDDTVGYSALVLAGSYPQPQMNNQPGRELCLFDRRTRTATVMEADSILNRRMATGAPSGNSPPKPQ